MCDGGLGRVGDLLEAAVRGGGVPGAVAVVGRGPVTLGSWVAGRADTTPAAERPMTKATMFDIASLTKVVATTTVALALAGNGSLSLDDAVVSYLPEAGACWQSPVTIWQLLTHTSGLPDSRKFYQWCVSREQLVRELCRTPLDAPPGTRVVYSDLGFIALGEIVAAAAGEPLASAVRRLVTGPLGMEATCFNPPGPPDRFAATELRDDGTAWSGTVHDENARIMGGVAGHAGLFAAAADLERFARWWVSDADGPVPIPLRQLATSCQTAGLGGCRGLGWVCPGDRYDILDGHWPPTAVSHTGFTGTSLALEPVTGIWAVLLTNAVHFGRDAAAVKALRCQLHAAVASALLDTA